MNRFCLIKEIVHLLKPYIAVHDVSMNFRKKYSKKPCNYKKKYRDFIKISFEKF